MTGDDSTRLLGSLQSADVKGVVRMQHRLTGHERSDTSARIAELFPAYEAIAESVR